MKLHSHILSCILLFLISWLQLHSQQWIWSRHFSSNKSILSGLITDAANNVYISGQFKNGPITIGPEIILNPTAATNPFIAKYDAHNNYLWNIQFISTVTTADIQIKEAIITTSENIVTCGFFDQDIGNSGDANLVPAFIPGTLSSWFGKYSSDGNKFWLKLAAWGPADVKIYDITVDQSGYIYVTGGSIGDIYFEQDTIFTSGGNVHNFIASYSPAGDFIWVKQILHNNTSASQNMFIDIISSAENDVYISGFYTGTLQAGNISLNTTSANNGVCIKLDNSGNILWGRQLGGTSYDRVNGTSADEEGNIYMTGYITGTAIFDSTGNSSQDSDPLTGYGNTDIFIAKYNRNGQLIWKKAIGDAYEDKGYDITVDKTSLLIGGYFRGSITYSSSIINSGSSTNQDAAFFHCDIHGNPIEAHSLQGNDNVDHIKKVLYDNEGNICIGGTFKSTQLVIGDSIYTNNSGKANIFIAKYGTPYTDPETPLITDSNGNIIISGKLGIGIETSDFSIGDHKLYINGSILAKEVKVNLKSNWSDFVFDEEYNLQNLEELEQYIEKENHLPDVPSDSEIQKGGVNLSEMNAILLQKIEELTLYIIEQNKEQQKLKDQINNLELRIKELENN